jgi:histidinol phosphatase-like enzyme
MLARHGRLLEPDEIAAASRADADTFGPDAQLRFFRQLEPPRALEGFAAIEEIALVPAAPIAEGAAAGRSALIFDYDGVLRHGRKTRAHAGSDFGAPGETELLPGRARVLREHAARGALLLGLSWQPDIGLGRRSAAEVEAGFARTHELLGVQADVVYCPHPPGPPVCWCRKPLPGLGALLVHRHGLDPGACTLIGRSAVDAAFARRLGFRYVTAEELFGSES